MYEKNITARQHLWQNLVVLLVHRHELYQLVIYMHEMMMQHLIIWQQ